MNTFFTPTGVISIQRSTSNRLFKLFTSSIFTYFIWICMVYGGPHRDTQIDFLTAEKSTDIEISTSNFTTVFLSHIFTTIDFQPNVISLDISGDILACYGDTNGEVNLTVSGGTPPYTFSWSNGATTEDISGLTNGFYTVVVTDGNGATETATAAVLQPTELQADATGDALTCYGDTNGEINLTVTGGMTPYSYSWSNGSTAPNLTNLAGGNYSVQVSDKNGCIAHANADITQPPAFTGNTQSSELSCYGDNNGSIDLTVSGGISPYSFSWSNGETSEDINNLSKGSYSVVITDTDGCTAESNAEIIEPPLLSSSIASFSGAPICNGSSANQLTATANGGTSAYTYNWTMVAIDNNGTEIGNASIYGWEISSGQGSGTINFIAGNTYKAKFTINISDANGCETASEIMIDPCEEGDPVVDPPSTKLINLTFLGSYGTGAFNSQSALYADFDHIAQRVYVTNAEDNTVDVLDISDPTNPVLDFTMDMSSYGDQVSHVVTRFGVVAVTVKALPRQNPGKVVFFNRHGQYINELTLGASPGMLTFTPNGKFLLVVNEGEPNEDYTNDPMGTVSVITLGARPAKKVPKLKPKNITHVSFATFIGKSLDPSIRHFGPGANIAQDLEPEFLTISKDSRKAYVVCQENNAIAEININKRKVTALWGMGFKNHNLPQNGMDVSSTDDSIRIDNWPVLGMYQPSAIALYRKKGKNYLLTTNAGEARNYAGAPGFTEEDLVKNLTLDPSAFPNATDLQDEKNMGGLTVNSAMGDTDGDGDYDELYAFGARSFSIYQDNGNQIYDSGDALEKITAMENEANFNSLSDMNSSFDHSSTSKGPQPHALTIGKVGKNTFAFMGLKSIGGIMVYDITKPETPDFIQYINTRDFDADILSGNVGDLGPEGILFIPKWESPNGNALLVVTNEISGTTTIFNIDQISPVKKAQLEDDLGVVLMANVPNPFLEETEIKFSLRELSQVRIEVFSMLGTQITTLTDQVYKPGDHSIIWNGTDASGRKVPPGIYISRMVSGNIVLSKKMIYQGR